VHSTAGRSGNVNANAHASVSCAKQSKCAMIHEGKGHWPNSRPGDTDDCCARIISR